MLKNLKNLIQTELNEKLSKEYNALVSLVVEVPKDRSMGDLAVPAFPLCRILHKNPQECAEIVKSHLDELDYFSSVEIVGGYVNASYSKEKLSHEILKNLDEKEVVKGKTIAFDYSSPNIAKPFSIGHLRGTVLGEALANLFEYRGYNVVRINYLGDFGTQFGKLIWAFKKWGNMEEVEKSPIDTLVKLYVRFNNEAKENPEMDDEAREIFKELEEGNAEYTHLWETFKEYSIKEFMRMYDLLGIKFDYYASEASASHNCPRVINILKEKNLLVKDNGAEVVDLGENKNPAIILKSDGSTIYLSRDLSEIYDRYDKFHFDTMAYVVGNEQKLHFVELRDVLNKMDAPFKDSVVHINFGLILQGGKKMSTRNGVSIKLDDVLKESIKLAKKHIEEKNANLENKDEIATKVGVSAVIFNDLRNFRENDYEFNLEDATRFEGQTGPYVQYTSVRIASILNQRVLDESKIDYKMYQEDSMFNLLQLLDEREDVIDRCISEYAPNYFAKYLLSLSTEFNSFYAKERVLVEDEKELNTKLYILKKIKETLDLGMRLLNMSVVEKM